MKFRSLMSANLFRKKTRLVLTIGCFAIALMLFGFLAIVRMAFAGPVDLAGADRLVIVNRTSIIQPLPLAYRDRILRIPGVKDVTHFNWLGGIYQDPKNRFAQFAIDVEHQPQMFPEFKVADDRWQTFARDRTGAIAGASLARRFGWKIGDRIPIRGTFFPGTWEFTLDGIYHADDETQFWFQWDYFEEKVPQGYKGKVGWYYVRVTNPDDSAQIAKAIDREFSNSFYETRTDTEKNFAAAWARQYGNIGFLVLLIGTIVFFTLLLITGNTMAIAVRERTGEFAVLKAVGFSDRFVLIFVLAESLVVAAFGGMLGLGLAKILTLYGDPTRGFMPIFHMPASAILWGMGAAMAVGVVSGILPAIAAMRLGVVEALRRA